MADPLQGNLRLGFPKENLTEAGYNVDLEYIGLQSTLAGAVPELGATWGTYFGFVSSIDFEDIEGTDPLYSIMRLRIETKMGSADYPTKPEGVKDETTEELDWAVIQRSMWEHPVFNGGDYALSSEDVEAINAWINETDVDKKANYEYQPKPVGYESTAGYYRELSANAKMFAKGIQRKIEYYNDYAPVYRKSTTYVGGPPPTGSAGQKEDPPVEGLPAGYEWIKNADRALKSGGQTRWRRDEEWLGAIKVLVDRDEIFWS
jgi:hypothetical protein